MNTLGWIAWALSLGAAFMCHSNIPTSVRLATAWIEWQIIFLLAAVFLWSAA